MRLLPSLLTRDQREKVRQLVETHRILRSHLGRMMALELEGGLALERWLHRQGVYTDEELAGLERIAGEADTAAGLLLARDAEKLTIGPCEVTCDRLDCRLRGCLRGAAPDG